MSLGTDIALSVVTLLDEKGYLRPGIKHKDAHIVPLLGAEIDKDLADMKKDWIKFCTWWGEISHNQHPSLPPTSSYPFADKTFWKCQHPMCLSLVGTIADLSRETDPAATPPVDAPASVS